MRRRYKLKYDFGMRAAIRIPFLLILPAGVVCSQSAPKPKVEADRLGLTCAQILKMSSAEWIADFNEKAHVASADGGAGAVRAAAAYGACYDARTDGLAASLARSGKGPSKSARRDFAEFEAALKEFADKALADAQPAANAQKRVLAGLYEKQFRYEFYQGYEPKKASAADAAKKLPPRAAPAATAKKSPVASDDADDAASSNVDEMTKAKNRFGELLGALPDEKLHELHAAFGSVVGLHELDNATRLGVYRYAIFLLEPSGGESSYAAPF